MQHEVPDPWQDFLAELDDAMSDEVRLHCLGGFVLTTRYGLERPTADIDVLAVHPRQSKGTLFQLGCEGSKLHDKHGVYLDIVAVATYPHDYDQRLTEIFAGAFQQLRLFALDPYDLALVKLERNIQRDRGDVAFLARKVPLDIAVLRQRYEDELRPYLGQPEREDLTLDLWIKMIQEQRR